MKGVAAFYRKTDKFFFWPGLASVALLILTTATFPLSSANLPPKLPLFYSLPWGESQLVDKDQFLLLPATLALINLVNILIASFLHPAQVVLKRTLVLSLFFIDTILVITFIKILLIFL